MSIVVSLAPLFGWKDENWSNRVTQGECMVSTQCGVIGLNSVKTVRFVGGWPLMDGLGLRNIYIFLKRRFQVLAVFKF